jgi:uncharacterized protein
MPEQRSHRLAWFATGAAVVLAMLCTMGGVVAVLAGWLAQPASAIAARSWRHPHTHIRWKRDALALALLWGAGLLGAAMIVAWPLEGLRDSATLGHVLVFSGAVGVVLIGLWRTWPLWRSLEGEGGRLSEHWRGLAMLDAGAWRGLGFALLAAAGLASILLLAWPDLLPASARWIVALAMTVAWPALHWALQRIRDADEMPFSHAFLEEEEDPEPAPAPLHGDLVAGLYAAARGGRVDHALALLEAGADPHALPPLGDRDQRSLPVLAAVLPDLRLLRALIAAGVDVNAAHIGMTPLLAATREGNG